MNSIMDSIVKFLDSDPLYIDYALGKMWRYVMTNFHHVFPTVVFPFLSLVVTYIVPCAILFLLEEYGYLQEYKIQKNKKNSSELNWKCVKTLIFSYFCVILPLYAGGFIILQRMGFSLSLEIPKWYIILLQLGFFLLCEDFTHYWFHRWLHHPSIYNSIHYLHHEFTAPSAMAASYAHPAETVILGLCTFSGPLILRPHMLVLFIWVHLRQFTAIETHCGFEFPFSPNKLFPWICGGADLHDFHHRTYNGAYSSNFIWWDIVFGTDKGYYKYKLKKSKKSKKL